MDEKKSVLNNDQAIENLEQDFQFANGMTENGDHAVCKQYNRDILLQLRLHPLSLQKPKELPEMEVIKDKLYLNEISDNTSTSPEEHLDTSNYHPSVKPDYCSMKPEYPVVSPYFHRIYPYCYSSHSYNGPYQPLKYRSSFNTYGYPLKKHCLSNHQSPKDMFYEEFSWAKHFASSDDMWSCYANHLHSGAFKRKEHFEAVPKTKKNLPIIDPATGKNVLETIHLNHQEENDVSSVKENSKSVENCMTTEKFCGDYSESHETDTYKSNEAVYDSALLSLEDDTYLQELKDSVTESQANINTKSMEKDLEETHTLSNIDDTKKAESRDQKSESVQSPEVKNEDVFNYSKTSGEAHKYDASKSSKATPKTNYNKEMSSHFDVHGTCRAHHSKDCHMRVCSESIAKQNKSMPESSRQFTENSFYSLKQEEQKVIILQSFLRYKKYQLEESARNLDEKRIEIANWEFNLHNKAKRLQEKEQWLANKNEMLNNKMQQLAKKEKVLNEEETFSGNKLYLDAFKEIETPKKFSFDNNDSIWNEMPKVKNTKSDENNEYSFIRCDSKPTKVSEVTSSSMEKCKSDAFMLDQLEKNLVYIEKIHSSTEVKDSTNDKLELGASPNAILKCDENASYDFLGYSKGRRYLPEHIKYWLDKRDKNAS